MHGGFLSLCFRQICGICAVCILVVLPALPTVIAQPVLQTPPIPGSQPKASKPPATKSARELVVSEKKGLLSLKAVNVALDQVLAALSKASAVPIELVDKAGAGHKITVSFQDMPIQAAVAKVMSTLSTGGLASARGQNGTEQAIYVVTRKGVDIKVWSLNVINLSSLVSFIEQVGSQDVDCEQSYRALFALNLGAKDWWQKTSNVDMLLDAAKNPELSTCARMVSLEIYIAKLSKEDLQKQSTELQTYFAKDNVPDKLIGRLAQLFAERAVPPTLLIEAILENDMRGQAARSHAWYAAGKTRTYSSHLLDLATQDATSADAAHSVSGKMALEYMVKSHKSALTTEDEDKLKDSVAQVVNRAITLPNDVNLNELGRSMEAVSAIPRFFRREEVVPLLGQVVVKASNDNLKLTAIDTLLTIRTAYESEVAAQIKEISVNLEAIFVDEISRERAKARLKTIISPTLN